MAVDDIVEMIEDVGQQIDEGSDDFNWELFVNRIGELAEARGEWAGYPVPAEDFPLVLEPTHPCFKLNGMVNISEEADAEAKAQGLLTTEEFEEKLKQKPDGEFKDVELVNEWWSAARHARVLMWHNKKTGKRGCTMTDYNVPGQRALFHLNTLGASRVWCLSAEAKALRRLSKMIRPRSFDMYILTGGFLESSSRSKVMYWFRRCHPTIALGTDGEGFSKMLATLCLHPIGHYQDTFAGCMVPTDDIIAHLTLMRGDEHLFWRKANHHHTWDPRNGL